VHLISDEIYAGSVYREERAAGTGEEEENDAVGGRPTFVSAMALGGDSDSLFADGRSAGLGLGPYVHLVYALSKDFALSGLRVGVAYTENEEILLPLQKLNDLCQISSQTQLLVERMVLADAVVAVDDGSGGVEYNATRKFTDVYLSSNRENIRARCDELQSCLDDIDVPYLAADSGLFVWMDMREFLPALPDGVTEDTESDESKDRRERRLYLSLMKDYGLLFTPGMSMRNERAGFFRFVFTAASEEEFDLGLTRLRTFVLDMRRK
jgi:aspartate/methionine/tyrosine aminotransferase